MHSPAVVADTAVVVVVAALTSGMECRRSSEEAVAAAAAEIEDRHTVRLQPSHRPTLQRDRVVVAAGLAWVLSQAGWLHQRPQCHPHQLPASVGSVF